MITLNISFVGNVNAENYNICYRPVGSVNYVCTTTVNNNIAINSGIVCGVNYEGYIETVCNSVSEFKSTQTQFFTTGVACQAATLTLTIDSVSSTCVYFTTVGPTQTALIIQTSTDSGVTWVDSTGSFISPRCDITTPTVNTKFRLKSIETPFVYSNIVDYVVPTVTTTYSFDGACGTGIPTRTKFGSDSNLSDGCSFSLVVTGGSIKLEANANLNSGTSLSTTFNVNGLSSTVTSNVVTNPGTDYYGNVITLAPGTYTGSFSYNFNMSQGVASVRITNV